MRYQTDEVAFFVFNWYVTDMSPVHHARRKIDQIVRLDGEEIRGHELSNRPVAVFPTSGIGLFDYWPAMHWLGFLLTCQDRGRQSSLTSICRNRTFHRGKRLHDPRRTGLTRLGSLFDDVEILINVRRRHL